MGCGEKNILFIGQACGKGNNPFPKALGDVMYIEGQKINLRRAIVETKTTNPQWIVLGRRWPSLPRGITCKWRTHGKGQAFRMGTGLQGIDRGPVP
tara:strand:+ start:912 stop:1199 length:288 start_codon:yes stop_codon:yes gene_type:complete